MSAAAYRKSSGGGSSTPCAPALLASRANSTEIESSSDPTPASKGTRARFAARKINLCRSSVVNAGYSPAAVNMAIPSTRAAHNRSIRSKAAPKSSSPRFPRGVTAATITPRSMVFPL
jgi:hypothetical protein